MKLPFISAKCVTYGRVNLLEEAFYSFLKQDYPKDRCELIIVNDYPLQRLKLPKELESSNIRIFNLGATFPTIGAKENFATAKCRGDIICQWDDDDVALPNHFNNVVKYFDKDANILHWGRGAYWEEPNIVSLTGLGNSGIVFRKSAWEAIGGHPLENAGYDMTFVNRLHRLGITTAVPAKEEVSWFYRWGFVNYDCYHQSGRGTDDGTFPNIIERHTQHIEDLRKQGKIPTGDIILNPHWNYDYEQQLKDYNSYSNKQESSNYP